RGQAHARGSLLHHPRAHRAGRLLPEPGRGRLAIPRASLDGALGGRADRLARTAQAPFLERAASTGHAGGRADPGGRPRAPNRRRLRRADVGKSVVNVGVRLPRRFEDSGDYLADARALESAGADSLWLDDEGYDPWLLLAGMATITGRIRLVATVSSAELRASQDLAAKIATLSRLSRGRLALTVGGALESPAAVDAAVTLARRSQCCVILDTSSDRRVGLA